MLVDNAEWLDRLEYIPFLRDFGTHFTVNRMLTFDSVRLRLEREQPLTLLEFNYMVMQAYDFLELSRRHGVRLQMGGSDQWGNIVNGVELGRRIDGSHLFGLTTPLDHHRLGPEDGQDRGGCGLARRRPAHAVRVLAVLAQHRGRRRRPLPAAVHRAAAGRDRAGSSGCRAPSSTRPRRCWPSRPPACATALDAAEQAAAAAHAVFEGGDDSVAGLPAVTCDAQRLAAGLPVIELLFLAGLAGLEQRGAAPGARRRRAPQRRAGRRRDALVVDRGALRDGPSSSSAGRKRHVLVRPG